MNGSVAMIIKFTKGAESSNGSQDKMALTINKSCKTPRAKYISETMKPTRVSKMDYSFEKAVSWLVFIFSPESSTLLGVIT